MTAPAKRVPVRYLALLHDQLRAQGIDTARLLRMAGIDAARFEQREATLVPEQVEGFIASARQLSGRTDLGFEVGRQIKMTSHDLLGLGMLSCCNLDEVLRLVSRHYHLMTETFALRYRRTAASGEALYTPTMAMPLEMFRTYCEALAIAHQNQVMLLVGADAPTYDIHLSMPEPPHVARYRLLSSARFHFDERATPGVRVVMGSDLLDHSLPLADARLAQRIDERCSALGPRPPMGDAGWGDHVKTMLREARGELVTLDELARRMNVSARTIDRRLKQENLQFRDLSQQVRFERACELLGATRATVAHVALNLGFSDAGSFSRAFRRVMGVSPSEYQQARASRASSPP